VADGQPFYSPNRKPPPARQPRPREHIWTLEHAGRGRVDCELLSLGESWGWSVELYRSGAFYGSRRFQLHADALRWAQQEREALEQDGWRYSDHGGH
jgi:hypothetical protein